MPLLINEQQEPYRQLEELLFSETIRAWINAATVSVKIGDSSVLERCILQMNETLELFDDLVVRSFRSEYDVGAGLTASISPSEDLLSLLSLAHRVYFAYAFAVRVLHAKQSYRCDALRGAVGQLEKSLRRSIEISEICSFYRNTQPDTSRQDDEAQLKKQKKFRWQVEDMYSYGRLGQVPTCPSLEALVWQLIRFVGRARASEVAPVDLVRLSFLLKESTSSMVLSPKLQKLIDQQCAASVMVDKDFREDASRPLSISMKLTENGPRPSGKLLPKVLQLMPPRGTQARSESKRVRSRHGKVKDLQ